MDKVLLCALAVCLAASGRTSAAGSLVFCCKADNDLFVAAAKAVRGVKRFDTPAKALAAAPVGSGILILADGYPQKTTAVDAALFDQAGKKRVRLFVEYPAALPGLKVGKPRRTHVERAVIASDLFGPKLKKLRVVSINGLHYVSVSSAASHIVAARVAGFDTAVYGLPRQMAPILFEMPGRDVLVATTSLSRFVTGRYAPQDAWRAIWRAVLTWLARDARIPPLQWTPTVRATYTRTQKLPADYELRAIRRGVEWYGKAKMIIHPSFARQVAGRNWVESIPADAPMGDGSLGSMEAVISVIHQDGSQRVSSVQRGDCICETAMALALGGKVLGDKTYQAIGPRLLDYYLLKSDARKKDRADPNHGAYGLIAWGITTPAWYKANYGDDNARQMMGAWAVAGLTGQRQWDEAMMMCLLANLRTTGRLGFRGGRIDVGQLAGGWEHYFHSRRVNPHPHYEAYLWACFLWAYGQTKDELFLQRAETALKMTMARYTDGWRWTNGLAQEKARILLPLAWLVRVKDTPETRAMLRKAARGVIALQDACGAIREELGLPGRGQYPPPPSNRAYGTNEASLIAQSGDPVADLLYTTNFAFLGLHEAAAALGDKDLIRAENKLAQFLCRIQVASDSQPAVDGGWFRAFDFARWEHWGCNADHGWGAWAIESGWTQGWIVSVLALRQMKTSLWDLTKDSTVARHHGRLRKQMMPPEALVPPQARAAAKAERTDHAAVGKPVTLAAMPSPNYPALGATSLTDGRIGEVDHASGLWLGFHADDLDATIDLGRSRPIRRLAARFLQATRVGIHPPRKVVFEISADGKTFTQVASVAVKDADKARGTTIHLVGSGPLRATGRYVRIRAVNLKTVPAWHPARGKKAWLFVDELLVNPPAGNAAGRRRAAR